MRPSDDIAARGARASGRCPVGAGRVDTRLLVGATRHTQANVHPPPLSLSQKLPSIRQFIGRYRKIKVMRRIATQITPNACHDLAPSGGIAAGQHPFRVRPHADLSNCGSYSQIPARGVRRWQRPAPTSSGVLSNICVAVCLSLSIFGYKTYK